MMSALRIPPFLALAAALALGVSGHVGAVSDTPGESLKLAGLYLKLGQPDKCREALTKLLKTNPDNVEGIVLLSKLELKQGNQGAALKAADMALSHSPDNIRAMIVKARILSAQGSNAEAQKLLALVPVDELEKNEAEMEGLTAAPKNDASIKDSTPEDPADKSDDALDGLLEEARHALAAHNYEKAGKLAAQAMARSPQNTDAVLLRADVLSDSGHPDEAVTLLRKLKSAHKGGPFPDELALASALQDSGKEDEAKVSFQRVADGSSYPDEDRKEARKQLASITLEKNLAEGDKELDAAHPQKALELAEAVLKIDPANEEAKSLKGRALAETGHAHEAVEILTLLKSTVPVGKRFDAQADYASALSSDHQYRESLAAYQEIEDHGDLYKAEEVTSAKEQMTELRDNNLAGGNVEETGGKFEEGTLWRTESHFSTARFGRMRYSLDTDWEHVKLDNHVFHGDHEEDRFTSSVAANMAWNSSYSGDLHVGAYKSGVVAGAGVTYHPSPRTTLALHANYNDPARDTLLLMAMDGRQHDLTGNITIPIGKHFLIESVLQARQVDVDGTNIGQGAGTETQFRWHPITNEDNIYLAYMLEYKEFDGEEEAFDRVDSAFLGAHAARFRDVSDAIPDQINRHALQAHGEVKLTSAVTADASAEIAWRQETKMVEYGATVGLEWQVTPCTSLTAHVEYYSGGSGPNSGAGVTLGTIGAKWIW